MWRADGFQELGEAVGDGAMARDGTIAGATGSQALRRRGEDELKGHQEAEVATAGNIAGEARCISQ